jgi:small subunit ribosomal protein S20
VASSEEKRHRQSLKRQARNQATKSRVKTLIKKVIAAAAGTDTKITEEQLRVAVSAIHKAGRKRVLHPNTAARRVARLSRLVHRSKNAAQSPTTLDS